MKHAKWHFIRPMAPEGAEGSAGGSATFNTVEAAVAELDRRDQARQETAQAEEAKAARAAPEAESEQPETDPPTPDSEETEQPEADESDEVTTDEQQEEPAEDEPAAELEEIEQDGKKFKIPKELKESFLRQSDYTRKTQEVAAERQQVHAAYQQTAQIAQQLQQSQAALAQFAQAMLGQPPGIDLIHSDPQGYLAQKAVYEQRLSQFQQLMGQGQQLTQHQQALQKQQVEEYLGREKKTLFEKFPELRDSAKQREFSERASRAAEKYGYTAQDVANVQDHRALLLLKDNMEMAEKLARYEKAGGEVKKKLANVPPKVHKPGPGTQDGGASQANRNAKAQFMKSGRTLQDVKRWAEQTS